MDTDHYIADPGITISPQMDSSAGRLTGVTITAWHPQYGGGTVELTPAQIACLDARLVQIDYASSHRHPISHVGSCLLPTGADAVLVTEPGADATAPRAIAIRRGRAVVHLTPFQLNPVRRALAGLLADEGQEGGWRATVPDGAA